MKVVIASGKGGAGKTMLSVNLAVVMAAEMTVGLLDCDVEEPDCHLYLRPSAVNTGPVSTAVPQIDAALCDGCGLCARACEFHALLALPGLPLVMPELCHGCGVCSFVCPRGAVSDGAREIGSVSDGDARGVHLRWGLLTVGEARSTPVIRAVKDLSGSQPMDLVIIDAPPGVACPVVETMRGADYVILVAEPTRFGLHDLRLAARTAQELGLPFGVVVNRAGIGDDGVERFCKEEGIPVLMEIPEDRRVAEACSRGEALAATDEAFAARLRGLAGAVTHRAAGRLDTAARPALEVAAS